MSTPFRDLAAQVATNGTIAADEILILRRAIWSDGTVDRDEAEALAEINRRIAAHDEAWAEFFVEALYEYLANGAEPLGQVAAPEGDWLTAQVERDGRIASQAELALLAKLFERATAAPERLRLLAIAEIERAVLTGEGPTRQSGGTAAGTVTDGEARLLRRLLFAPPVDRAPGIGRAEAELLFRLKDAALGGDNAEDWTRLFVQGLAGYLAAYAGTEPLSRERAADLEEFLVRPEGLGRFVVAAATLGRGRDDDGSLDPYERALVDFLAKD